MEPLNPSTSGIRLSDVGTPGSALAHRIHERRALTVVSHACIVPENQRVYTAMAEEGWDVTLVTPRHWRHEFASGKVSAGAHPSFTGTLVRRRVFAAGSVPLHAYLGGIRRILRRSQPEVILIDQEPYSIAGFQWARAAVTSKIPYVFTTLQNIPKRYPLPVRLAERFVSSHSRAAVAITQNVARALRERGYSGQVTVVPLPVDVERFANEPVDPALRAELRLRRHVVGFVGRLVPEKGILELVEAYSNLGTDLRERTTLLVVGDGPLAKVVDSTEGAKRVVVPQSEVPRFVALMDVLVLASLTTPTWKEQLGRAAIEAMAAGKPVVGSSSGEIPNVVSHNENGLIVPEGNASSLAAALRTLLTDPSLRAVLGSRAKLDSGAYAINKIAAELMTVLSAAASHQH